MNKREKFKDFLKNTYIHFDFDISDDDDEFGFIGTIEDFIVMTESKTDKGMFYQMYHYGMCSVEFYGGNMFLSRIDIITKQEYEKKLALQSDL